MSYLSISDFQEYSLPTPIEFSIEWSLNQVFITWLHSTPSSYANTPKMSHTNPPPALGLPPNVNLLMPMPIPGTSNVPLFNGRYSRDFLAKIEFHRAAAGIISKDLLVDYIYDYSTDEVKAKIWFLPEFNKGKLGKVWVEVKAMLVALYGILEVLPQVTKAQLTSFCTENANKAPFPNKKALETYYRNFLTLAAPLVENGQSLRF